MRLLALLALLAAPSVLANSANPGSCAGPAVGHGASSGSTGYAYTASGQLTAGLPSTVVLSGLTAFKGFLALQPSSGGRLSAPSVGAIFSTCGYGHTEPSLKNNVSLTFTPTASASASTVTLTGYIMVDQMHWYSVSSVLQVAAGAAPQPVTPAVAPPSAALALVRPLLAAVAAATAVAAAAA